MADRDDTFIDLSDIIEDRGLAIRGRPFRRFVAAF